MKSINVGIFHGDELGHELGKKGTESDIVMFNRKKGDCLFTFMQAADDKVAVKGQIMSAIDAAIVKFAGMTPSVGETILMLNAFGISKGVIVVPPEVDEAQVKKVIAGTSVASFRIMQFDVVGILDFLEGLELERATDAPALVVVDHAFNVKGVGDVVLGFVKSGVVKKYAELQLMPLDKEVIVRSIQMHDEDFDEAPAGSRVGFAMKGAIAEEMKRGTVLCALGTVKVGKKIPLSFQANKFYTDGVKEGMAYMTVGMQSGAVRVSDVAGDSLTIEADKQLVYTPEDVFLLLDLNAAKLHLIGKGTPAT